MATFEGALQRKIATLALPLAVELPGGRRVGAPDAALTLLLKELSPLVSLAQGQIGLVARAYVEGRLDFEGSLRSLMSIAAQMVEADPVGGPASAPLAWWRKVLFSARSASRHRPHVDARQIQFHYDVSDDFYRLWLDPQQVYSCAYYARPDMTLAQAQTAKLDHICRKLMLREGERFLDVGAGWGALLMHAAEHYGVRGHGITLSRNQHAHVQRLIDERGLSGRVTVELRDYRDLPEAQRYDKIASVGMFEHVGRARLPDYFGKLARLLEPGGLLMNHGITAGGTHNDGLGAGMGDFIERYIFPGGELLHVSHVLKVMSEARLEALDVENLRPHYARTLWAWSDALEARLPQARLAASETVVRAFRLYLAGSAMCFEQGWISLHQMLATRPNGDVAAGSMRGAQSSYPFHRDYMYPSP
ncbi:MAG: cyclopropane-fatty-acyl-phospholipid synthase family protein [Burkholderiaceae bacterium]